MASISPARSLVVSVMDGKSVMKEMDSSSIKPCGVQPHPDKLAAMERLLPTSQYHRHAQLHWTGWLLPLLYPPLRCHCKAAK